jgi:excinuclease ABC subunit C
LVKISEEVHRFAIDFHRKTRNKKTISSPLDDIIGIGDSRKKALLSHFTSIKEMVEASDEELKKLGLPEAVIKQMREDLS